MTAMLLLGSLLLQAVAVPTPRSFGAPDATLPHEFVRVFSIDERPDGRLVVVDRGDDLLAVADFRRGTVTRIGRTGAGPEEYRFPGRLAPLAGDSLMVADDGNNRLAVLGPDLRIHRVARGRAAGFQFDLVPRAVDQAGRFYCAIPAWMLAGQGRETDSLPVVRFVPGTGPLETIVRLKARAEPPPPSRRDRPTFSVFAFAPGDSWAVTPAGRLAVVRADEARVEWIEPDGRRTTGPPIQWRPMPVTARDRSDFVRGMLVTSGTSGRGGVDRPPGGLTAVSADQMTDQAVAEMVANMTFAKEKPAFTDAAPIVAPDGTLWVERSVPAGGAGTWILFDAAGRPGASWPLPAGRRLVGVGRGRVYLVSADDDGIERLERYAVPR